MPRAPPESAINKGNDLRTPQTSSSGATYLCELVSRAQKQKCSFPSCKKYWGQRKKLPVCEANSSAGSVASRKKTQRPISVFGSRAKRGDEARGITTSSERKTEFGVTARSAR